jgi:hypothetical protein
MNQRDKERLAAFVFGAILLTVIVSYPISYKTSATTAVITINDKERITQSAGEGVSSKYIVYTEEGEVFENTDSMLFGKFNSSDVYGKLRKGKRYRVSVAGWRVHWMSSYRNIISPTHLPDPVLSPND